MLGTINTNDAIAVLFLSVIRRLLSSSHPPPRTRDISHVSAFVYLAGLMSPKHTCASLRFCQHFIQMHNVLGGLGRVDGKHVGQLQPHLSSVS